jgi:hypothetical protein
MFPARYFAPRYLAPRYWPEVGEELVLSRNIFRVDQSPAGGDIFRTDQVAAGGKLFR